MGRFEKGKPRPAAAGRRAGTPNKATRELREMILGALDEAGGQAYLTEQARENPKAFLSLLGRVLPTTLAGDPEAPMQIVRKIYQFGGGTDASRI